MAGETRASTGIYPALERLEQALRDQQRYIAALTQGLAGYSSEVLRTLEYRKGAALSGVGAALKSEEASLKRRLSLYRELGLSAQALESTEGRLLQIYERQGSVYGAAQGAYVAAGREDLAERALGLQQEAGLRAAAFLRERAQAGRRRALETVSAEARGLEAFLDYAKVAGVAPEEMERARARLTEVLQQKGRLEWEAGDLAAYYRTQREGLRHRAPYGARAATSPWSTELPRTAGGEGSGLTSLLRGVIGGYGLRGPLYSPLGLARAREVAGGEVRMRDKMTIVVELRPPGRSEDVFLEQWAELLAGRLARWLRAGG